MSREGKNIISRILEEKRKWNHVSDSLPEEGQRVVIRMVHNTSVFYEDETKVYPAEDMKIGRYVRVDDGDNYWAVDPPYPKFDYSPLSHKSRLAEGVTVTHWAVPEDGECDAWDNRYNITMPYKDLHISVDPDNEERVYRAIMWGASFLGKALSTGEDSPDEIKGLWVTICDHQSCFDQGIEIKDGSVININSNDSDKEKSTRDLVNEINDLANSSQNICKCIYNVMDRVMNSAYTDAQVNDINIIVARLWCMYDMLTHEFRKRTVTKTAGVDLDKLPPMFFQKLGERFYETMSADERKKLADSYIAEYVTPYEQKKENNKEE